MTGPARGAAGFTLIEILVALFIFLAGVSGILALMTTGLALHRDGLQLGRAARELDDVAALLARELAAGRHVDGAGDLVDVPPRRLADGSWIAARLRPGRGEEPPLAELRLAGSEAGLAAARVVRLVLPEALPPALELARLRAARLRAAGEGKP